MNLFESLSKAISENGINNAFYINGVYHNYRDFAQLISNIRTVIGEELNINEKIVAIISNDDLETYATIIALWFEGKAYVPISPDTPLERNQNIIKDANIKTIFDSSNIEYFKNVKVIQTKRLFNSPINLCPKQFDDQDLAYMLFTSGTTGKPKGVPITRQNLVYFVDSFWNIKFEIDQNDKCLQMFELAFDLSVFSYLIPLLKGACIYTIPKDKIKYSYIYELMEEHELTFTLMVPSILHYLRPYFDEIKLPKLRYSLFAGEALPLDVTTEWSKCVNNAKIINLYGPSEGTIFCTYYNYNRFELNKSHHGVLSIGKPMKDNYTIIVDENNQVVDNGREGELCLKSDQLTPGYWNNKEKNEDSFFTQIYNSKAERFYKTGDLCKYDKDGDILYLGRIDFQTKIQGFRVELSEIEFYAKQYLEKTNVVVIAMKDQLGNTELGMAIEEKKFDSSLILDYMKSKLPPYMIPKKVAFTENFPLNSNGKIDRKHLELIF